MLDSEIDLKVEPRLVEQAKCALYSIRISLVLLAMGLIFLAANCKKPRRRHRREWKY